MFLVLLLLVGGVVGLLLKSNLEAPEVPVDCDVGPWEARTDQGNRLRKRSTTAKNVQNPGLLNSWKA